MESNYLVYADGACKRNGRKDAEAEGSFAVYYLGRHKTPLTINKYVHEKLRWREPIHHEVRFKVLVERGTNNMAEARALQTALVWLAKNGYLNENNHIYICMDSRLVLSQFLGLYKVTNVHLRNIYQDIYAMLSKFNVDKQLHLQWIPGEVMKTSVIAH